MKKKPRADDETLSGTDAKPAAPGCWDRDPNAQALRVEMSDGSAFVFPYAHLSFAKLESESSGETLRLMFGSHEVCVTGKRLREILLAVQKLAVESIKELPARYSALSDRDCVFVEKIEVKALTDDASSREVTN